MSFEFEHSLYFYINIISEMCVYFHVMFANKMTFKDQICTTLIIVEKAALTFDTNIAFLLLLSLLQADRQ